MNTANKITAADLNPLTKGRNKMRQFIDNTIGRVGKWGLWKLGLVDLMWFFGMLRVVRTDSENGIRFILPNKDWSNAICVDNFFERPNEEKETGAYDDKRRFRDNGWYGYGEFTGFFSKPKIKNHIFKSDRVKMLHAAAAWDRDVLKEEKMREMDSHAMQMQTAKQYYAGPSSPGYNPPTVRH